jgi:four helix bundle protein
LSVPLNTIEGFARKSDKSHRQFLLIAYGSLKETKYLLDFCKKEGMVSEVEFSELYSLADEVGKLLWSGVKRLEDK